MVQSLAPSYKGRVEVKVYTAGKDFDYLQKYGNITKSMLIINESKAVTQLDKTVVRKAFEEALQSV